MIDIISITTEKIDRQKVDCQGVEFNVMGGKITCIQYEKDGAIYLEYIRDNFRTIMVLEPVSRGEFTLKVMEE